MPLRNRLSSAGINPLPWCDRPGVGAILFGDGSLVNPPVPAPSAGPELIDRGPEARWEEPQGLGDKQASQG